MVRTFLKVYMELGSYFLFLQEQIKDIIIPIAFQQWVRLASAKRQIGDDVWQPGAALRRWQWRWRLWRQKSGC
jgi:hypothetical protein